LIQSLRPIKITRHYLRYPEGSCLFQMGETRVLCAATINHDVPDHAERDHRGWLTAEYSMLPRATTDRTPRGRIASAGRTKEIQRLIGRSIRAVMDLSVIPELGIVIDCDVLQADGGTRTASVNGGFIALVQALRRWKKTNPLPQWPIRDYVAAVSVGLIDGKPSLDLDYERDIKAEVDLNVVMTGSGHYVEVQGNAEHKPFTHAQLESLLKLAQSGIRKIIATQRKLIGDITE
jgi:ribonuclease PH